MSAAIPASSQSLSYPAPAFFPAAKQSADLESGTAFQDRQLKSTKSNKNSVYKDIRRGFMNTWNKIPPTAQNVLKFAGATGVIAGITGAIAAPIAITSKQKSGGTRHLTNTSAPNFPLIYPYAPWNGEPIKSEANCYAYFRNHPLSGDTQPGDISGHPYTEFTCANIIAAAKRDGLSDPIQQTECSAVCPPGTHAGFLMIAPNAPDYHWHRENSNQYAGGSFSQKHGKSGEPTNLDASNNVITCPGKANNNYPFVDDSGKIGWLNYTSNCGFLCAPDQPPDITPVIQDQLLPPKGGSFGIRLESRYCA